MKKSILDHAEITGGRSNIASKKPPTILSVSRDRKKKVDLQ